MQKSVSFLHILTTAFWRCRHIFINRTYIDTGLIDFLHFRSMVDPLGDEEVFIAISPAIGHSFTVNDVVQPRLNWVVQIMEVVILLDTCSDIVTKPYAKVALVTVVSEIGCNWCRLSNISFLWSILESGDNCCSSVVT